MLRVRTKDRESHTSLPQMLDSRKQIGRQFCKSLVNGFRRRLQCRVRIIRMMDIILILGKVIPERPMTGRRWEPSTNLFRQSFSRRRRTPVNHGCCWN